jgi:hypothetical protein
MIKHSDYLRIFIAHMDKFCELEKKRDEITKEMRRVHQMAKAALAMLPDEERQAMQSRFREWELPTEGLTAAIRHVLLLRFERALLEGKRGPEWMTPMQIKEELDRDGYDFSAYKSNPLVSVHAILKRLDRKEVNHRELPDGTRVYKLSYKEAAKRLTIPSSKSQAVPSGKSKTVRELVNDIAKSSGIKIAWPEDQMTEIKEATEEESE